ncbi:MAG: DEAD/DEAH box helicase family protein [Haloferacaceae archaeon]
MTVRLTYADGTIRLGTAGDTDDAPDVDLADLPGVEPDPRTGAGAFRAPAHRYGAVRDALADRGVDTDDAVLATEPLDLTTDYRLRPYQSAALAAWREAGNRGVVEMPTGSGKTVVAIAAIAELGVPALVVVPTLDLLTQWRRELSAEFDRPVGQLGGGEQRVEALTVATYDSAYLRADDLGDRFGLIVFDEAHHLGGEGYRDAARLLAAPSRLGLTATFERPDGAHEAVADLIGGRVYALDPDDLAGEYLADYDVKRIEVDLTDAERERYEDAQGTFVDYLRTSDLQMESGSDWRELVKRSGTDPRAREALLAKQRAREIMMNADRKVAVLADLLDRHRGDRVIVFAAHTDLVYRLSERFLLPAVTNETENTQANPERERIIERFRRGEYTRIVTANVLDEGIDVPAANIGILLSGSGSEREFTQRLGRVLRPTEDENRAILYEVVTADTAEVRVAERRR